MEPIPNEVDDPSSEIAIRTQGTRRDQSCFGFLSIPEIRLCGIMPMLAANPLITNVTKVVRTDPESENFLKCSTANKFRKQRLSLILDQKVLQ